ncbi:hypothetical protein [Bradyrhizobium sp. ORS 111]|uniref:hypothetical protein n=1 Tax=Bradyrhizobium sp. ORS 111 TaxID=1685958 RepID=UPI00388DA5D8
MEPGFSPKWTKDDSHLFLQMAVGFTGFGAVIGFLSDEGLVWGAIGGFALAALIAVMTWVYIAWHWLRS